MVYYFEVPAAPAADDDLGDLLGEESGSSASHYIYMGKDKFENEPLVEKSHPKNIWFHVDNLSLAHLYYQLPFEMHNTLFEKLELDPELLKIMGQLTKANLIKGSKLNNVTVIYTPVENVYSNGEMDVGTVTFKNSQKVKRIHVAKKDSTLVNRLNKLKKEVPLQEFVTAQEERIRTLQNEKRQQDRKLQQQRKQLLAEKQKQREFNKDPYADMFGADNLHSNNENRNENWVEDDFW